MLSCYKGIIFPKIFIKGDYDRHSTDLLGRRYCVERIRSIWHSKNYTVALWLVQLQYRTKREYQGHTHVGVNVKPKAFSYFANKNLVARYAYFDEEIFLDHVENLKGDYVGDMNNVLRLIQKYGITEFEKAAYSHNVCSIGFSPRDNKWYGWSHRAIYGFGIGYKVLQGACEAEYLPVGYTCKTLYHCKQCAIAFAKLVS